MRKSFLYYSEQEKNKQYQRLCDCIANGEIEPILQDDFQDIDLAYNLPLSSAQHQSSLEAYYSSPLGLILCSKHKQAINILNRLFDIADFSNIAIHGPVYVFLAAKHPEDKAILIAQQIFDLCFRNKIILDLNFHVNRTIVDIEIIGEKDALTVAIEHGNENFIKWIFQPKFISNEIIVPKINHFQLAIKFFSPNILDFFMFKINFSAVELKQAVAAEFPFISKNISYLNYLRNLCNASYQKVCEYILDKAVKECNLDVFFWLLNHGAIMPKKHRMFLKLNLAWFKSSDYLNDLILTSLKYENFQVLQELLVDQNVSIIDTIKQIKAHHLGINSNLYEMINLKFNHHLLLEENLKYLKDYIFILEPSLVYKLWENIVLLPNERFLKIINYFYGENLQFLVLDAFLYFVSQSQVKIIKKFLQSKYKDDLLNGDNERTPLSIASENNDFNMTKILLANSQPAQVNRVISKSDCYQNITALWLSLSLGHKEQAELLLNYPEIEKTTIKGWHHKIRAGASLNCKELGDSINLSNPTTTGITFLYHEAALCDYSTQNLASFNDSLEELKREKSIKSNYLTMF